MIRRIRSWKRRETPAQGRSKRVEKEVKTCIKSYDMLAIRYLHADKQDRYGTSFGRSNNPALCDPTYCITSDSCMVAIVPGRLILMR